MSEDLVPSWVHAFPWLDRGVLGGQTFEWETDAAQYENSDMHERLAEIADYATSHFPLRQLFDLYPFAPREVELAKLDLSVRASNVLRRANLEAMNELLALSISELFGLRTMGVTLVREILVVVGTLNILHADGPSARVDASISAPESAPLADSRVGGALFQRALAVLATWQTVQHNAEAPLFSFTEETFVPDSVMQAQAVISRVTASNLLGENAQEHELHVILDGLWVELDERQRRVAEARILANSPITLDALGVELGVTRERVRQIESKVKKQILTWFEHDGALAMHLAAVRNRITGVRRLEGLLEELPQLKTKLFYLDLPAWYVLDKLNSCFQSDGQWIAAPSLPKVGAELRTRFDNVSVIAGMASIEELRQATVDWPHLSEGDLVDFMILQGFRRMGDQMIAPELKNLPDLAAMFLHRSGAAATAEKIASTIAPDRSVQSLRNAMAVDERFIRVDVKEWGLRVWGEREYTGIRSAISDVIREQGELRIDDLVAIVTSDHQVSPRSIVAYASSWPFELVAGIVRLAQLPKTSRRPLSQTRNLYRRGTGSTFRIILTNEHLRGSGFPMPTALASEIGLKQGEKIVVRNAEIDEDLTLTWATSQPSFGSIRRHISESGCAIGDELFIELSDGNVRFRMLEALAEDPKTAISQLMDIPAELGISASTLAFTLGLDSNSPWARIVHVLRDRGEVELANRVVDLIGPNPAFDLDARMARNSKFAVVSIDDPNDE